MSNAPAIREMPDQAAPTIHSLALMSNEQIAYIASTEVVPKHLRGHPQKMLAVILKGRSLGFDDIQSLDAINFIDGKATLSAEAMVALVRQKGHSIVIDQRPGESATVTGKRKDSGDEWSITWTMEMAKQAGLIGKDNWKRYPDTMLTWRAISQVCRFLFPDVLRGVSYTEDEALEASERNHVTEAVRDLPPGEEQAIRQEPIASVSEAQLNRIVRLQERIGEGHLTVLRGVFGVEMASELSADAAGQYEAMLEQAALPEEPAAEPLAADVADEDEPGGSGPTDQEKRDSSSAAGPDSGEPAVDPQAAELPLEDEPAPDEVVDGEVVEEAANSDDDPDLVRIAGTTEIPIGSYKGTALNAIHDSWLEWALDRPDRLPGPFNEAVELFVRNEKPDIWQAKRG